MSNENENNTVSAVENGKTHNSQPGKAGVRKPAKRKVTTKATPKATPKASPEPGAAVAPPPVPEPTNANPVHPDDGSGESVDLLALLDAGTQGTGPMGPVLEVVRLGSDETPLIPFTSKAERVTLHYCNEPEINGYVQCNGTGCALCKIGKRRDERLLIPVYLPAAAAVGVLPISPALRPHALFPQLAAVLKADKPMVAFVSRDRDRYTVSTAAIGPDTDAGDATIKAFLTEQAAGRIKLSSVMATFTNEQLAGVPAVARMLALRGAA